MPTNDTPTPAPMSAEEIERWGVMSRAHWAPETIDARFVATMETQAAEIARLTAVAEDARGDTAHALHQLEQMKDRATAAEARLAEAEKLVAEMVAARHDRDESPPRYGRVGYVPRPDRGVGREDNLGRRIMTEFGHTAVTAGHGFHLDTWGAGPFTIADAAGKEWFFEDSDRFGPFIVHRKTHVLLDRQPGELSPFWRAHLLWVNQGRRVQDGRCIWEEPKPTTYQRVTPRHAVIVDHGDEHGAYVEVQSSGDGS